MRKPKQGNHHFLEDSPVSIHLLLLARHPLTEEVGPTEPLPESVKALDFFQQMFDHGLMEHI